MLSPARSEKKANNTAEEHDSEPETINAYERQRLERIARNKRVLADMGIVEAWQNVDRMTAQKKPKKKREKGNNTGERRRSARLDPNLKQKNEEPTDQVLQDQCASFLR